MDWRLLLSLLAFAGRGDAPPLGLVVGQLWWLLPFILFIAMVGVYISMWAVPLLAPAIVGVLYMTEISAAAISSALWSGEPFGLREILGIALITVAAVLESARDLWRDRRLSTTIKRLTTLPSPAKRNRIRHIFSAIITAINALNSHFSLLSSRRFAELTQSTHQQVLVTALFNLLRHPTHVVHIRRTPESGNSTIHCWQGCIHLKFARDYPKLQTKRGWERLACSFEHPPSLSTPGAWGGDWVRPI